MHAAAKLHMVFLNRNANILGMCHLNFGAKCKALSVFMCNYFVDNGLQKSSSIL